MKAKTIGFKQGQNPYKTLDIGRQKNRPWISLIKKTTKPDYWLINIPKGFMGLIDSAIGSIDHNGSFINWRFLKPEHKIEKWILNNLEILKKEYYDRW